MLTGGNLLSPDCLECEMSYTHFIFKFFVVYGYTWLKVVLWTLQVVLIQDKNAEDCIQKYIKYWFSCGLSTCLIWIQIQKICNSMAKVD